MGAARVALVTFSTSAKSRLQLTDDKQSALEVISNSALFLVITLCHCLLIYWSDLQKLFGVPYRGGKTNTAAGIEHGMKLISKDKVGLALGTFITL